MSKIATSARDIPTAPYYVLATDKFMSGWGMAEGKTNVCVFPCATYSEAVAVMDRLGKRPEMIRIRWTHNKPRVRRDWVVSVFNRDDAPAFYGEGVAR